LRTKEMCSRLPCSARDGEAVGVSRLRTPSDPLTRATSPIGLRQTGEA